MYAPPQVAPTMNTRATLRGAVFLDRDGTINRSEVRNGRPYAPVRFVDFEILPDAAEAVARFHAAGYPVIVVTNQPDLSSGKQTQAVLDAMHDRLRAELPVDDIFICPHTEEAACDCRKPKPGLILEAARKWEVDLNHSIMIGDRWRDVEAGRAAGCMTVFIDRGYSAEPIVMAPDMTVGSLGEAAESVLAQGCSGVI